MINQILNRVTVTGVDDSVHPIEIHRLAQEFPFVEFGILLSRKQNADQPRMNIGRYPSKEWLRELVHEFLPTRVQFSGHICGAYVREILRGDWPEDDFSMIHPNFERLFSRFQLNTAAQQQVIDPIRFHRLVLEEMDSKGKEIIFQQDGVNYELLADARDRGFKNISTLYDKSGGAGVMPLVWPNVIPGVYCGYAGGLGPENIVQQLHRIEQCTGLSPIWIDAETHLRSSYYNNDAGDQGFTVEYFDLDKVRAFLSAAKPWVINGDLNV